MFEVREQSSISNGISHQELFAAFMGNSYISVELVIEYILSNATVPSDEQLLVISKLRRVLKETHERIKVQFSILNGYAVSVKGFQNSFSTKELELKYRSTIEQYYLSLDAVLQQIERKDDAEAIKNTLFTQDPISAIFILEFSISNFRRHYISKYEELYNL